MKLAKLFAELALWTAHHNEHGRAVWTERGIGPELEAHAEASEPLQHHRPVGA